MGDGNSLHADFWLVRDYVTEVALLELARVPPISDIAEQLGGTISVTPLMVPWDCADGVLPADWRRPSAYLDARVRARCSGLAQTCQRAVARGMARLAADLRSGLWERRNADLLGLESFDAGFRLLVSDESQ
ncbi:MAG: hypothetical protein ACRDY2_00060 [Acidimicrobiales bacterium]